MWDCCTDPFWGCCPRCGGGGGGLESCLLLRCCGGGRQHLETYYEIDLQQVGGGSSEAVTVTFHGSLNLCAGR